MDDLSVLVSGIEHKLMLLLKQQQKSAQQIESLSVENQKLKLQVVRQQQQINQLTEQLKVLLFSKDMEHVFGKSDAKKRINELLRDIEKCIALLS